MGVIDRDGMAVSRTKSLHRLRGSRVVVPSARVLLNKGMVWFDPEPGRSNSVAGGKRPLRNMAPAVLVRSGQAVASGGASGGRRILNAQIQPVSNLLDHGLGVQDAIAAPWIDASTGRLRASARLPTATRDALAALGHDLAARDETIGVGDPCYLPVALVGVDGARCCLRLRREREPITVLLRVLNRRSE